MYRIIDGKKISSDIKLEIAEEVRKRINNGLKVPHLAAILVGNNGSSVTYVTNKVKDCEEVGFKSSLITFEESVAEKTLLDRIKELNDDRDVDGFIVQLPLPVHISEEKVIEAIHPSKDADGFHPENLGRMMIGMKSFLPATPFGIVELIRPVSYTHLTLPTIYSV